MKKSYLIPDKTTTAYLELKEFRKSELSNSVKDYIKYLEKEMERICRKIWAGESKEGIIYLYSNFCKKYDKVIVTLAYYMPSVGWVPMEIGH